MLSRSLVLAALALAACATSSKPAPAAPVEVKATGTPGQAAATRLQKVSATVTAVDAAARKVTVKVDGGGTESFVLGPEVERFAEIVPGDRVVAEIEQGLLLEYQAAGSETVEPKVVVVTGRAGAGEAAGAGAAAGIQGTVTVTAIDLSTRLVSFQGPAGRTYQVKAGPKIRLEKLKVGDRLLATYVETTAVRLEKAPASR